MLINLNSMKSRLTAYWWCQISGWSAYILFATLFYLSIPDLSIRHFLPPLFLAAIIGMFITHLMRLFIIKTGLLELYILKQVIYLLFTTILFSFIDAVIMVWLAKALHWGNELINLYSFENKVNKTVMLTFSNSFFIGIWNLIYFSYHYIEKSRKQQIENIMFENELKVQKLESKRTKAEFKRRTTELELQAMIATQEQERKRISRDLHDDIGTKLSALRMVLSSLNEKAAQTNNEEIRALAESSELFVKEAM